MMSGQEEAGFPTAYDPIPNTPALTRPHPSP